jgi:hypothetical protein
VDVKLDQTELAELVAMGTALTAAINRAAESIEQSNKILEQHTVTTENGVAPQ